LKMLKVLKMLHQCQATSSRPLKHWPSSAQLDTRNPKPGTWKADPLIARPSTRPAVIHWEQNAAAQERRCPEGVNVTGLPQIAASRQQRLAELGRDLLSAAYLQGDFVLSSGVKSRYYFDKYLFETKPGILRRLASFLAEMVPPQTDRLAGPELGAVALATAVSLETGLPFVIVKKEQKGYATSKLVEGELYPGERVVVVEDVLTTGAQAIRAAQQVARAGAQVLAILGVIDREQGAPENIAAAGFEARALFRRSDLGL